MDDDYFLRWDCKVEQEMFILWIVDKEGKRYKRKGRMEWDEQNDLEMLINGKEVRDVISISFYYRYLDTFMIYDGWVKEKHLIIDEKWSLTLIK